MHHRADDPLVTRIVAVLTEVLFLPPGSLTPETRLADLDLDSLDLMEAMLELEIRLGYSFDVNFIDARTTGELTVGCMEFRSVRQGSEQV